MKSYLRDRLLATTVIAGLGTLASPIHAQATSGTDTNGVRSNPQTAVDAAATDANGAPLNQSPATAPTAPAPGEQADQGAIIVTGTLFRNPALSNPSPVLQLDDKNLEARGITTIQGAIQTLAANNGPALTNSFSANGAFASGASAVSLRGLSTNSTLVLFDGLRAAYYPLADDGTRNFVDLNTVPDELVERIDVLLDGASSTYGADAIAGVVNVVTKKNFKGFAGRAEGNIASRGDAAQYRLSGTAGVGDLDEKGFNAYISGFYYHQASLRNSDRPYPFNSDNFSRLYGNGGFGPNNVLNGVTNGSFNGFDVIGTTPFAVRPYDPATKTYTGDQYQYLGGCQGLPTYNLTAAERANPDNNLSPSTVCQEDKTKLYGLIQPKINRYGVSARGTARYGDNGEVSAEFNFLQTDVRSTDIPTLIFANAAAPFYFPQYSTRSNVLYYGNDTLLQLPVYICPANTVGACTAQNGRPNPNNPFAAQGRTAALIGGIPNRLESDETRTRAYRGALTAHGPLFNIDGWSYNVGATAMHIDLQRKADGYVYIQHLLNVIKDGSYNFLNPFANSKETIDYIEPTARNTSTSDLDQVDANVSGKLIDLPGGPLELAVGGAIRYEAVDAPSINSDINGGTERYFRLNGFATKGHRTVYSAYGELNAPILKFVTANLSGRYDKYPNGIDNFSPKAGLIVKPISSLAVKGTYSRGFRIPSFGESSSTFPTTGYVNPSASTYNDEYLRQYGCSIATFATACPNYLVGSTGRYGATNISNPNLKPEKSRSFTGGVSYSPLRGVTVSADYYNIRKTRVITTANLQPAIDAYYAGQDIPAGYQVIADAPDQRFPNARPRIAFVQAQFINANKLKTSGIDMNVNANRKLTPDFAIYASGQASYIIKLEQTFPDGSVQRYDGTLGPYQSTAATGTPKWKAVGTLGVTLFDKLDINGTANYFDGYNLSATDANTEYKDCGLLGGVGQGGGQGCNVHSYVTVDLNVQFKATEKTTFYASVQNVADRLPPLDLVTYGAHAYNPVAGATGIWGRYFQAGVKFGF